MLWNREQLDFIPGVVPAGQVNHHYVPTIPPSNTATEHKQPRQNSIIFLNYPRAVVQKIALYSPPDYLLMAPLYSYTCSNKTLPLLPSPNYRNNCERNSNSFGHLCFSVK